MISARNVVGQFGLKKCQKMREVINHNILKEFSFKSEKGFKNPFSTELCSELDSFFSEAL